MELRKYLARIVYIWIFSSLAMVYICLLLEFILIWWTLHLSQLIGFTLLSTYIRPIMCVPFIVVYTLDPDTRCTVCLLLFTFQNQSRCTIYCADEFAEWSYRQDSHVLTVYTIHTVHTVHIHFSYCTCLLWVCMEVNPSE